MLARMWMPSRLWILSVVIALLALSSLAFAQGGATGGGKFSEWDFQTYIERLGNFMQTDEGRRAFPEIYAYDLKHRDFTFNELCRTVKSVIKNEPVFDKNNTSRDCVGYALPEKRYFKCDESRLPLFTVDNQPRYYGMILHELLVLLGIEKPVDLDIPSEYPVSRRIKNYLRFENGEWLLGKQEFESILKSGIWCSGYSNYESVILIWSRKKQVRFATYQFQSLRVPVQILYRSQTGFPKTIASNRDEVERRQNADFDGYPAIVDLKSDFQDSLTLLLKGNPFAIPKLFAIGSDLEQWAVIKGTANLFSRGKQITSELTCQSVESWQESVLSARLPGLLDRLLNSNENNFFIEDEGNVK